MDQPINETAIRQVFRCWWGELTDADNDGVNRQRGPLARLRRIDLADGPVGRAPDVIAALAEESFRTLWQRIGPLYSLYISRDSLRNDGDKPRDDRDSRKKLRDDRVEDLVTAAVTLARLREDARGRTTAQLLGGPKDEDRVMKEGRFLALMRVQTSADLFDQARRLPDLLDRRRKEPVGERRGAPVGELGAALLLWRRTPRIRRNWARDYYHLDIGGRESPANPAGAAPAPIQDGA